MPLRDHKSLLVKVSYIRSSAEKPALCGLGLGLGLGRVLQEEGEGPRNCSHLTR